MRATQRMLYTVLIAMSGTSCGSGGAEAIAVFDSGPGGDADTSMLVDATPPSDVASGGVAVLNFSDLLSGPRTGLGDGLGQGVIVTVWGNRLGEEQGDSRVYFTDTNGTRHDAAHVYYWSNADGSAGGPANLFSHHQMQEIAFSIPAAAGVGLGEIAVEVSGQVSNSLPFTIRPGDMFHVKATGNDATGDGSFGNPWLSFSRASYNRSGATSFPVQPGATVYIGDGVFADKECTEVSKRAGVCIRQMDGTAAEPVAFVAYPGASVRVEGIDRGLDSAGNDFLVLAKLSVMAGSLDFDATTNNNFSRAIATSKGGRIIGNEITDRETVAPIVIGKDGKPVGDSGCADGFQGSIGGNALNGDNISGAVMYGNHIHDWGCIYTSKFEHTTYFSNRSYAKAGPPDIDVEAWEFGWNLLENNDAKNGIHNYDENLSGNLGRCGDVVGTLRIHHNVVLNQRGAGIVVATRHAANALPDCWSMPVEITNNLLVNVGLGPPTMVRPWDHPLTPTTADLQPIPNAGVSFNGLGMTSPVKIYNNTIAGFGDANVPGNLNGSRGGISIGDRFNGTIDLRNNIIVDREDLGFIFGGSRPEETITQAGNNIYFNPVNSAGLPAGDSTSVVADPRLDAAQWYCPEGASPAIAGGVDLSPSVTNDLFGSPRSANDGYDVGSCQTSVSAIRRSFDVTDVPYAK